MDEGNEYNIMFADDYPWWLNPTMYAVISVAVYTGFNYGGGLKDVAISVLGVCSILGFYLFKRTYESLQALNTANAFNESISILEKEGTFLDESCLTNNTDDKDDERD